IEARSGREIVFEELVEKPWMAKGKSKETMTNFFDRKSRYATEYVDGVIAKIKGDVEAEKTKVSHVDSQEMIRTWLTGQTCRVQSLS
ncbi:MAG TPA: hypothetical protein VN843_14195, partial [Anaerolineales bacterium]|nr:hypothetical protein [Anaerolineales bacterium]